MLTMAAGHSRFRHGKKKKKIRIFLLELVFGGLDLGFSDWQILRADSHGYFCGYFEVCHHWGF